MDTEQLDEVEEIETTNLDRDLGYRQMGRHRGTGLKIAVGVKLAAFSPLW